MLHDIFKYEFKGNKNRNVQYINKMHIRSIEKMIRLHYQLGINIEGMDVIYELLNRVESLQAEIIELRNKLNFYEAE